MYNISIIGAGNIAYRFSQALFESGNIINFVYNRTPEKAQKLSKYLNSLGANSSPINELAQIFQSDIIIIAVSDDAIKNVVEDIALAQYNSQHQPIFLHTSGATDIEVLKPLKEKGYPIGVLYPLMTLSKTKNIKFNEVPFLLEAQTPEVKEVLENIVKPFKTDYDFCDSEKRLRMHAGAVFSCNFINYILELAFDVAGNWSTYLIPTTIEMVRKSFLKSPQEMRTGPAVRGDMETIKKHMELLESLGMEEHKEVYELITKNIIKRCKKTKN